MKPLLLPMLLATAIVVAGGFSNHAFASETDNVSQLILKKNTDFWQAYNTCNTSAFGQFFTADVEFYHDKGGITNGLAPLVRNMQDNLCGGSGRRLRREAVPGSEVVFPLRKGKEVYGAVLSGEHLFYVSEPGKPEYLDGRARFTHLWIKQEGGEFKMSRVLSYDHGPAVKGRDPETTKSKIER